MRVSHRPLTRTPAPSLDFSRPSTPVADDFGDIYFSTDGGLAESRVVFLAGCDLPDAWMDREVFTIGELGFGSGLNFLAVCQAWAESGATGRLHFISVEAFPFSRDDLQTALSVFPDLGEWAQPLIEHWPGPVKGFHRRHFGPITLTLIHDTVDPALAALQGAVDAWFLDGFSPAKNPDMWNESVMAEVARLSAPGARLATFTVAGAVRRALEAAGFSVTREPGFGRKRHRLEARFDGSPPPDKKPEAPTIVGAGIAGASIARAFTRRGMTPRIIQDPDHIAASGNGAALIKPRLDLQDHPASRFFLSSFLYARDAYGAAIRHAGVTHLPKSDAEAARFARIIAQDPLGPGHLNWTGTQLDMPSSLVIDTEAAREIFLDGLEVENHRISDFDSLESPVILACGYGINALLPDAPYRFSRGQLSWARGALDAPLTYGGYAVPIRDRILLGATHDRLKAGEDPFALRPEDDARNLGQAQERGLSLEPDAAPHRASVRVTTADTLPRMGVTVLPNAKRAHILSGLGSRGFVFAPLLGEALVCDYLGEPSPLELGMIDRLSRDLKP